MAVLDERVQPARSNHADVDRRHCRGGDSGAGVAPCRSADAGDAYRHPRRPVVADGDSCPDATHYHAHGRGVVLIGVLSLISEAGGYVPLIMVGLGLMFGLSTMARAGAPGSLGDIARYVLRGPPRSRARTGRRCANCVMQASWPTTGGRSA